MTGVLINAALVLLGSAVGLMFKRLLPEKLNEPVMTGIGLCTLYIGVSGALRTENALILIASMVLGAITGTVAASVIAMGMKYSSTSLHASCMWAREISIPSL